MPTVPVLLTDQLNKHVRESPDKTAIYFSNEKISYRELNERVNLLSYSLMQRNMRKGDRVFLALRRHPDIIIAFLAVVKTGGIAVPFNFKSSKSEMKESIRLVDPVGMIIHPDIDADIPDDLGSLWRLEMRDDFWRKGVGRSDTRMNFPELSETDPIYLNFTSGSTGNPKAAIATHRQLYANTKACIEAFNMSSEDVHLPLFAVVSHPHEIFCRALFTGASVALVVNIYPRTIAQAITRFRVTCVMAVPPVYELLLPFIKHPDMDFSSVRLFESGGMVTSPQLRMKYKDALGVGLIPVWGSTETMGVVLANDPFDKDIPPNSCGICLNGYEAKICDEWGRQTQEGEIGELWIKGAGLMTEYWRNSFESRRVFENGYFKTGDLFHKDETGRYIFHGRSDSMIKVGGLKVYLDEIESVLFAHPMIREAVVVPYHDRLRGIVPLAAVVIEPGESLTEAQLRRYLSERLSLYKTPRFFRFLPDLPRTSGGKIDRKAFSLNATAEMTNEKTLKSRIRSIDLKILRLLNERLTLIQKINQISQSTGFDPEGVQKSIRILQEYNSGPLHDSVVEELFEKIMSLSLYL